MMCNRTGNAPDNNNSQVCIPEVWSGLFTGFPVWFFTSVIFFSFSLIDYKPFKDLVSIFQSFAVPSAALILSSAIMVVSGTACAFLWRSRKRLLVGTFECIETKFVFDACDIMKTLHQSIFHLIFSVFLIVSVRDHSIFQPPEMIFGFATSAFLYCFYNALCLMPQIRGGDLDYLKVNGLLMLSCGVILLVGFVVIRALLA